MTPDEAQAKYDAEWPALNAAKDAASRAGDSKAAKEARQMLSRLSDACAERFKLRENPTAPTWVLRSPSGVEWASHDPQELIDVLSSEA